MVIFFIFSPISIHLHPLQADKSDSNSRLVVDEDGNGKLRLERVKDKLKKIRKLNFFFFNINYYPVELSNLNFHSLEVVSRYRDPQLQMGEN